MKQKRKILDTNYQKAYLNNITSEIKHLSHNEKCMLHDVLSKYEFIFDGTLGTWKPKPVHIELQPGAKPYNSKRYLVTHAQKAVFKKEVERLFQIGVLKR